MAARKPFSYTAAGPIKYSIPMPVLIPTDYKQCQTTITPAHSAFRMGPKPREERCTHPPAYVAYEVRKDDWGRKGTMSVCEACSKVLLSKIDRNTARLALLPSRYR